MHTRQKLLRETWYLSQGLLKITQFASYFLPGQTQVYTFQFNFPQNYIFKGDHSPLFFFFCKSISGQEHIRSINQRGPRRQYTSLASVL